MNDVKHDSVDNRCCSLPLHVLANARQRRFREMSPLTHATRPILGLRHRVIAHARVRNERARDKFL